MLDSFLQPNSKPPPFNLHSGGYFHIRTVEPDDRDKLIHLFDTLSAQSRYFRFAHVLSSLPEPVLDHLLHIDPHSSEIALVAELGELPPESLHQREISDQLSKPIIGISRCIADPHQNRCEFSISVSDPFHGEGVGSQLMLSLIKHATQKGFKEIYGYVLSNNTPMLELMEHLGFRISPINDDLEFKFVTKSL